jgi:hypothetical protein
MRRVVPVVLIVLSMLWTARVPVGAQAPAHAEEVFRREVQAIGQAWQFSGVDLPKGYVATLTASGKWDINATWDRRVGAGGHPTYKASDRYVKGGASEGCLLVRTGDTVLAFSRDDEVIRIDTPGKIYFCANDEPTEDGAAQSRHYVGALPIPATGATGGQGFLDNSGTLEVRIAVKKAEK